ncbi:MAG TPA: ribosome maturation factor RimM [Acidimicrobiia bacterium]|nr:ribosome maturation factor RimM [Acidimicrobiia bacterium]
MRLEVGRIGRAHGLQGEVSIAPISNRPERFARGSVLFAGDRELVVASSRRHQDRLLVRFEGVVDREGAEALRNLIVTGDAIDDASDGVLWVHEMVGAEVRDRAGREYGHVAAVEANPAHDLLVLESGALVPIVFVVSNEPGALVIDPPEGLFDL